jgi:hypothetical protein
MEASVPLLEDVSGAQRPLRIVVSPAGHHAALRALVAQCVPVLQNPEAFTMERRRELAERLARAIQPCSGTKELQEACPDGGSMTAADPCRWIEDEE